MGKMGAGKSTWAKSYAKAHPGTSIMSLATPVKQIAAEYFGMTTKDRRLLQRTATALRGIDEDVWINALMRRIDNTNGPIVVDDVRFPNEARRLKAAGFTLILLEISPAEQEKRLKAGYGEKASEHMRHGNHESERPDLIRHLADYIVRDGEQLEIAL